MKKDICTIVLGCSFVFSLLPRAGEAIQCFQCDSNEDDSCPSWQPFDRNINALVDCTSFEARTPGTFCLKITQQSPGWWGWIKQTRRCGSRSDTGVAWGCRWVFQDNGVWIEMCYCDDRDGCNGAIKTHSSSFFFSLLLAAIVYVLNCFRL
jgi:hypothetical protein